MQMTTINNERGFKMNERQAIAKGYSYNGAYSRDKEVIKARITDEKKKGNKAILVTIPPNKLSRSASRSTGYSMYIRESEKNKTARLEKEKQIRISNINREIDKKRQELADLELKLMEETGLLKEV